MRQHLFETGLIEYSSIFLQLRFSVSRDSPLVVYYVDDPTQPIFPSSLCSKCHTRNTTSTSYFSWWIIISLISDRVCKPEMTCQWEIEVNIAWCQ